jgi:hypothetical protein
MDKFDPIPFPDAHRPEVFAVDVLAVNLHNDRGIVLIGTVQQVLNAQIATFNVFGKSVEREPQFKNLSGVNMGEVPFTTSDAVPSNLRSRDFPLSS